jgi:protein TonB
VAVPPPPPPSASAPLTISPSGAREGYQKARQARPGCVNGSLRLPRDIPGIEGETAMIKFQVSETGAVSEFIYLSGPTDQRVASAIWSAVQRCEWVPGASAQGRPLTLWVTMPIRFGK